MKYIKYQVATILLLVYALGTFSQSKVKFNILNTDVGLSENFVNAVVKDRMGFIWIGTRDGLNRYDGYSFKIYKNEVKAPGSLSNNTVQSLFISKDGTLWVGTRGGLNKYDYKTDRFIAYKYEEGDQNSLSNNAVYSIYEDHLGVLWVGTFGGGACAFDRKKKTFKRYMNNPREPGSLSGNAIRAITEDNDGELWVGVDGAGLNKFNRNTQLFTHFRHNQAEDMSLGSDIVLCIMKDREGLFWVGSWASGITRFDPRKGKAVQYLRHDPGNANTIASDENFQVVEASTGDIWIDTRKGLDKLDPRTGKITHNQHDPLISTSLSYDILCNLYEDSNGILWACTEGGGVCQLDLYKKQFVLYENDYKNFNSISYNDVTAITQDTYGNYWAGTLNGLNKIDGNTGQIKRYYSEPGNNNSLVSNNIQNIIFDSKGNLWVGTSDKGVSKMNINTGACINYTQDESNPKAMNNNAVYCLLEDRQGDIWVGTYGGGINILNTSTNVFRHLIIDPKNQMQNVALSLFLDSGGDVWCGTMGHGLLKINPISLKFTAHEFNPDDSSSISNNIVFSVAEAADFLWVCTGGGGVNRLDKKTMKFKSYTVKDGLPSNQVFGALADDKGNLWFSTSRGLSKHNIENHSFRNYDQLDGLQGNSFNQNCAFKNSKGELFFGGKKGFNCFFPDSIRDNMQKPSVVITDFKIFNESVIPSGKGAIREEITMAKEVVVHYSQNNFSFAFAALHYSAPAKNRYKYMMEGYDETWIETDNTRRFASYTNLPGGEYTFRVIASNNDNVWNDKGVSLSVVIVPPFWKTYWFFAIIAAVIAAVIYMYIRHREAKTMRKRILLEQEVAKAVGEVEKQKVEILQQNAELQKRKDEDAKRQWVNEGLAKFGEILRHNRENVTDLSHNILTSLIQHLGATQGGIFLLNDEDDEKCLELVSSYGYNTENYDRKRIAIGEGLVGNCFVENKMKLFEQMPDGYLELESAMGHSKANTLVITPLCFDENIVGVLEISLLKKMKDEEIEFLTRLAETIASQLFSTKMTMKTTHLLELAQMKKENVRL